MQVVYTHILKCVYRAMANKNKLKKYVCIDIDTKGDYMISDLVLQGDKSTKHVMREIRWHLLIFDVDE